MRYGLTDMMNDMFDDMFRAPVFGNEQLMKTDIRENDGKYILEVELPGYEKEEVKISLYNGNLTVSAEHHEDADEKDSKGRVLRQERYGGSVSRTFRVGDTIKESDIHASFNNGILRIELPTEEKKEEESRKYIEIL